MLKVGVKIPLKPFFTITGILLGLLCFVFVGYGIRELQMIGWVKETRIDWVPTIPILEIRPFLESTALQIGVLLSFLVGWILSSRLQSTSVRQTG